MEEIDEEFAEAKHHKNKPSNNNSSCGDDSDRTDHMRTAEGKLRQMRRRSLECSKTGFYGFRIKVLNYYYPKTTVKMVEILKEREKKEKMNIFGKLLGGKPLHQKDIQLVGGPLP